MKIEVGVVELHVKDLDLMRHFYEELIGLKEMDSKKNEVTLGYEDRPIVRLVQDKSLTLDESRSAGLYHLAILFDNQSKLAQTLVRILQNKPQLYQGSADHLVSEAFYFADPEGNGVELYFDKDSSKWIWINGRVAMDSLHLDVMDYTRRHIENNPESKTKLGHIHLKVGAIDEARQFYVDVLGFKITAEMPSALFVSDGKYHHHVGINVWESMGAGPRSNALGLKSVEFVLETTDDFERLVERLSTANVEYDRLDELVKIMDPWRNEIRFKIK